MARRGPPLELWHTFVPHDLSAAQIDRRTGRNTWPPRARSSMRCAQQVTDKLPSDAPRQFQPLFFRQPDLPGPLQQDWIRSYVLMPAGAPVGAVALLHGLTDSPYSLRHIARRYVADGFVAVAIRPARPWLGAQWPGQVEWEQWTAATRLAVRHRARRLAGPDKPLHLIGFSNGGALAMKYALEALERQGAGAAGRASCCPADDRHHQHGAFCRRFRAGRRLSGLRQGGVAGHRARV